jgi:hypothetical protein
MSSLHKVYERSVQQWSSCQSFHQHIFSQKLLDVFQLNLVCVCVFVNRLCGLVVRVLGYRFGGPGSIPGTTRFSGGKKKKEKKENK